MYRSLNKCGNAVHIQYTRTIRNKGEERLINVISLQTESKRKQEKLKKNMINNTFSCN